MIAAPLTASAAKLTGGFIAGCMLASAAHAQTPARLTPGELAGAWTLTIRANPPAAKGPKVTFGDGANSLVLQLDVEPRNGALGRCMARKGGEAAKAVTCRLQDGVLLVELPASARNQQGFMTARLARTSSGGIAGPTTARAARLPMSIRIGTATLTRAS